MTFFQLANTSEGLWPFSEQSHILGPIATRRRSSHTCRVTYVGEWWISCCSLSTSFWGLWHLKFVNFRFLRCKCHKGPILSAQSSFQPAQHPEDPSPSLLPLGSAQSLLWDNEQLSPFCLALCLHPSWIILKIEWYVSRIYSDILIYISVVKWLLHSRISPISFLCVVRAPKMHSQHFQGSALCGQLPAVWPTGSLRYRKVMQYFPVNFPTHVFLLATEIVFGVRILLTL